MTAVRNTSTNAGVAPRVFLSYARTDGEPFATNLRQRLEAEHIPLWQDRVCLEFEMLLGIPESQAHHQEAWMLCNNCWNILTGKRRLNRRSLRQMYES